MTWAEAMDAAKRQPVRLTVEGALLVDVPPMLATCHMCARTRRVSLCLDKRRRCGRCAVAHFRAVRRGDPIGRLVTDEQLAELARSSR